MLHSINRLNGSTISASDGEIGRVTEAYFDDQHWAIRYLVVETGSWLLDRRVLVSPYSVRPPIVDRHVQVSLTRQQIENSPPIDTHQPVSRRHEREFLDYYAYPEYWAGDAMWAMSALPLIPPAMQMPVETQAESEAREAKVPSEDVHLRSSDNVSGYDIQASDDSIGHVQDFIFDDESWAIRYLVVDTRNWWPGGKKVLIATHWIDSIDWADRTVRVNLTRAQVKSSPDFTDDERIDREYEAKLHEAYARKGYWGDS